MHFCMKLCAGRARENTKLKYIVESKKKHKKQKRFSQGHRRLFKVATQIAKPDKQALVFLCLALRPLYSLKEPRPTTTNTQLILKSWMALQVRLKVPCHCTINDDKMSNQLSLLCLY